MKKKCEHNDFDATVVINKMEDRGIFMVDVKVECRQCETPLVFTGLPSGVDLKGAAVSADGTEARLAACPKGETVEEIAGVLGFHVRRKVPE